jgi:PAS domain-containing protein
MPIGIFQCTPDGYVSYANEAWYELAGYPRGKGVTNWGDYIAQQDQARIRGVWEAYLSLGQMQASAEWQWTNRRYGEHTEKEKENKLTAVVSTKVISLQTPGDDKPMGSIGCCVSAVCSVQSKAAECAWHMLDSELTHIQVDITDRILHENLQKQRVAEAEQRRAEAEEAKFQQELLIDITS